MWVSNAMSQVNRMKVCQENRKGDARASDNLPTMASPTPPPPHTTKQ